MAQPNSASLKTALVLAVILAILTPMMVVGSIVGGLQTINPENQHQHLVYPLGDASVNTIWTATVVLIPLSLTLALLAGLNFKLRNLVLNKVTIITCAVLLCWLIFVNWALSPKLVSPLTTNDSQSQDNGIPQAKPLNLK